MNKRSIPADAVACDAVVAGHVCLDVIPDLSGCATDAGALVQPGRLAQVGPVTFATGGPVSNTGLALHRLGISTRLMGKVGDDPAGQVVRDVVASCGPGLADGFVVDATADTSYTVVVSLPGADRAFWHHPGANDTFSAADVRWDVVAGARLFHFGYPPLMRRMIEDDGAELIEVFCRVKETGATASLDMAFPDPASPAGRADWPTILRGVLPLVDVFVPSLEELLFMLHRETYGALVREGGEEGLLLSLTPALLSDVGEELLAMGAKVAGLKLGERGLYVRTAGERAIAEMGRASPPRPASWADKELWVPCFRVDVVGTTGAGDATVAGLLGGLLRGLPLEEAATAAVAVGACCVEAADALGGIRSWEETWQRVEDGWPRRPLEVEAPGWRFDERQGLWVGPAGD